MKTITLILGLLVSLVASAGRTHWIWNEQQFTDLRAEPGDEVDFMGDGINLAYTHDFLSGTKENPIVYQSGNDNTIISGYKILNEWQGFNEHIYYVTLNQEEVNNVSLDGNLKAMGRYPNSGYLTYVGHAGNGTIWGPYYLPTNFVGAEAVVKKERYLLDRYIIKYQGHDYLEFNLPYHHGSNDNKPTPGNGFFIQGHLATLDQLGEWYFDKDSKRLYMYFGDTSPSQHTVKVAGLNRLINIFNKAYINIKGLHFEGADTLVSVGGSTSIKFYNSSFKDGVIGLAGGFTDNIQLLGCELNNLTSSGVYLEMACVNTTIERCSVSNIGLMPGMGNSGGGTYTAITVGGNNTYIRYNNLRNIGFNGITYQGSNVLIEKNLIDGFCLTKDDGAGIYTFAKKEESYSNRVVRDNIIINAIGCSDGALGNGDPYGEAAGIYNDGNSSNIYMGNNFIANGRWVGILNSPIKNISMVGNMIYNFGAGIVINEYADRPEGQIENLVMKYNMIIAFKPEDLCLQISQFFAQRDFRLYTKNIGDWGYNVYLRPLDQSKHVEIRGESYLGAEWKKMSIWQWREWSGQDINSQQPDVTTNNINNFRMEFNASDQPKVVYLDGLYQGMWGEIYYGIITVSPYSGMVILKMN